jgi:thiamine biosynthesis lipoprotein
MAQARLERLERTWSRFLPDSELSRANASPGTWVPVSPETVLLVRRALEARDRTGGLYDPTLLHEVVGAGYARSFDRLASDPGSGRDASGDVATDLEAAERAAAGVVELDPVGGALRVAVGCGFDPGGIGKGTAADLVVGELLEAGADGACVNVGGDLRVAGAGPAGADWVVAVEDPRDPASSVAELVLADGALATSSRCRRCWTGPDGRPAHHLIDPRTGRPAQTPVLAATVVAATGWQAEALAKAAFLGGVDHLDECLAGSGATGLLVTAADVVVAPGLGRFRRVPDRAGAAG